jgi:S1-C subfamily serine protease
MSEFSLKAWSDAIADIADAAAPALAAVHVGHHRSVSAVHWGDGLWVAPEERIEYDEIPELSVGGETVKTELVGRDPTAGVALLRANGGGKAPVLPRSETTLKPGHLAIVAARDVEGPIVSTGTVAKVGEAWRSMRGGRIDRRIILTVPVGHHFEGGAVLDAEGKLVGFLLFGPRRRAIVIPAETIARSVETLTTKGHVARGYLGARLHPVRDRELQGAIIVSLDGEGPARAAGLQVGDVVTAWNGEPVRGPRGLMWRLGADAAGQTVTLSILRGGAAQEVTVKLGEKPIG